MDLLKKWTGMGTSPSRTLTGTNERRPQGLPDYASPTTSSTRKHQRVNVENKREHSTLSIARPPSVHLHEPADNKKTRVTRSSKAKGTTSKPADDGLKASPSVSVSYAKVASGQQSSNPSVDPVLNESSSPSTDDALHQEKENQELQSKVSALERELLAEKEKASRAKAELNANNEQIIRLQNELETSSGQVNRLQTENKALEKEKVTLRASGQEAANKATSAIRVSKELQAKLTECSNRYNEQGARVDQLQRSYDAMTADKAKLETLSLSTESEVNRLRQERSAQASLTPASSKTEEEYSRDIQSLNQKVKDLAHLLVTELAPRKVLTGTRKEQRVNMQTFLHRRLWNDIFFRMLAFLTDEENQLMRALWTGIEPDRKKKPEVGPPTPANPPCAMIGQLIWKSLTFSSMQKIYPLQDMIAWTILNIKHILGDQIGLFSTTSMEMFEEIIGVAVEIQFSIGQEAKNIQILYATENSDFDPAVMQDVNNRTGNDHNPVEAARSVDACIEFGCQGSGGIEQKCSVVLA